MRSSEKLARALEGKADPMLAAMVQRAREGYYGDYTSPLTFPEHQLVADLEDHGYHDLAERVKNGEFDGTKAEAEEWMAGPEGQALLREVTKGKS